ncbi:MAG: hypothetical protein LLG04_04845 [Parachlamydia sp.]|nr:hypothetical protein [Parachlamydia sp.]
MAAEINHLRQIASFKECYTIEGGRIRLSSEDVLLKTHAAAQNCMVDLMRTHCDHPDLKRVKQNLQLGPSKYPVYFAALDVLRAAFANLPSGSWAIYSSQECLTSHVIWKSFDQQVNMRGFRQDSELNGLRASALQESNRVQIL